MCTIYITKRRVNLFWGVKIESLIYFLNTGNDKSANVLIRQCISIKSGEASGKMVQTVVFRLVDGFPKLLIEFHVTRNCQPPN